MSLTIPIDQFGAVVACMVRPVGDKGQAFEASGYLDTGASDTSIDPPFLDNFGYVPVDSSSFHAPGAEKRPAKVYDVEIALVLPDGRCGDWKRLRILGVSVMKSGCNVALGRDFLASFRLLYDGPNGVAELRW